MGGEGVGDRAGGGAARCWLGVPRGYIADPVEKGRGGGAKNYTTCPECQVAGVVYGGTGVDASQPFEVVHPPPSRITPSLPFSLSLSPRRLRAC